MRGSNGRRRLPFEEPFWSGRHPGTEGRATIRCRSIPSIWERQPRVNHAFELVAEEFPQRLLEPETVPLVKYRRSR